MKAIYNMRAEGVLIREIVGRLGVTRVTVRKYLRSETILVPKARDARVSKLTPWAEYLVRRVREDRVENCSVLLAELRFRGYQSGPGPVCPLPLLSSVDRAQRPSTVSDDLHGATLVDVG